MNLSLIKSTEFWESDSCEIAAKSGERHPALHGLKSCVLFRTSGTTGGGSWVVLSKSALQISANAVNQWLDVDGESRWGLSLPMNHVGGFGVVARAHAAQCGLSVFNGKWNPQEFRKWLADEAVTHVSVVPTQLHDLMAAGLSSPSSLRAIVVGGGRLDAVLGQTARNRGWPVLASFGMTETCSQVGTQEIASLRESFVQSPIRILPIWETRLSDSGRLMIRGNALLEGSFEQENNEWLYRPRLGDWWQTSDRAELSGDVIIPKGRVDSIVKILGELVDLEAVEQKFISLAGEDLGENQFAVVAIPDPRREHALVAVFQGKKVVFQKLYDRWQIEAAGIERFSELVFVEELPTTELGKLKRGALQEKVIAMRTGN
ncbi:AMP-binding protein [Luteolibacter algae]|uniref:AMP-binding protein n=1 Tax=Luteolibacter algae TaxID=454151 RepID=A0ABW5DA65_9BACT